MQRAALLESLIKRIGVPAEQHTVGVGKINTWYLAAGAGPPVVLVHGGDAGTGALRWLPVIGPLAAHFRVIAPDMVGYGESDKPSAPYDRRYFSTWLTGFIDAVGLQRASLVGHSLGGAITLQFTLDNPERVDRLVLVNSAGLGRASQRVPLTLKFRMICHNLFPSPLSSRWFLEHQVLFDPKAVNDTLLELEEYGRAVIKMPGGRRVFWQGRGRAVAPMPLQRLGRLSPTTLIVWGEADPNFPLASAEAAARVIRHARLKVIPNSRHLCFFDRPEVFSEVLLGFLLG